MKTLLDNQIRAINKLKKYKVGALFMDPGTGKTRIAYELIKSVTKIDYCLWLTPFQTIDNLYNEINLLGGLDCDIFGIESLSNSDRIYFQVLNKLETSGKSFIVCDESLKIKNSSAIRTQRIIKLSEKAEYKLILNGTPLSRNLLDMWSQMEFLSPKILKMSEVEFKNTFCEYVTITKRIGNRKLIKEFITKYHNVEYLYSIIEPFIFESRLSISPGKQYININYELTPEEIVNHNMLKEKFLDDELMEIRNNNIFLEITAKLQHNYSLSPEKIEIVKKIIQEKGKENILIFARFINTQEQLKKIFPVKIVSWQKHSFGLNLQQFSHVIFFDKVWDYALRDQAEHRIYRIGQKEDCFFYDLTGNVGLEDMMNRNIWAKGDMLNAFKKKSIKELQNEL